MENSTELNTSANQRGGGRNHQSKGRKNYQRNRVANMRVNKGEATVQNLRDSIRSTLFVGSHEDDALARLSEQQTLKAITLSITTRGIGLGICHLTYISEEALLKELHLSSRSPNRHDVYEYRWIIRSL